MSLTLSAEQEELRAALRRLLAAKASSEAVRSWMESEQGYDPALWQQMADQMGLHGLAIPEEYGGLGFALPELVIVAEEMGRSLVPSPYFASIGLAAQFLVASGDDTACRRQHRRCRDHALGFRAPEAVSAGHPQRRPRVLPELQRTGSRQRPRQLAHPRAGG